jgi:hypothetical protein
VNTLHEIFRRRGNFYKIYPAGVEGGVRMDYYQYHALLKLRQEHSGKVLRVRYLPHTKLMLRYE